MAATLLSGFLTGGKIYSYLRSHEMKKEGSGSNNWGTIGGQAVQATAEEIVKEEEISVPLAEEKKPDEETKPEAQVEEVVEEKVQKEPDEMTLEEYEKIREEKRKTLEANKSEERKVEVDKAFKSMQLVEKKKEDDVFIKLGDDKGKLKKKEMEKEKEERARKVVSINEFLKPAEGDKYHGSGGGRGHGRGEGRGDRRGNFAGGGSYNARNVSAPHIEDPGQFPTLGGK
jgi:plasminogen activator inhibitor 1 RNA-binding protein